MMAACTLCVCFLQLLSMLCLSGAYVLCLWCACFFVCACVCFVNVVRMLCVYVVCMQRVCAEANMCTFCIKLCVRTRDRRNTTHTTHAQRTHDIFSKLTLNSQMRPTNTLRRCYIHTTNTKHTHNII